MRLVLKALLGTVLALVTLLLLVFLLLGSEGFNRWLFNKAQVLEPRLELAFVGGDLWHGWQFDKIAWHDTSLMLDVEQLDFAWSPSCLLGMRLCIDRLHSHSITVVSQSTEEANTNEPFSLPEFSLPLAIELDDVRIDRISLDGEKTLLSDLILQANAKGDQLAISEFSGVGPDLNWKLSGALQMQDDWPLTLGGRINLPPVDSREWSLDLQIGGALKKQLQLTIDSSGYLSGQLQAEAAVLDTQLPANLHWQGDAFLAAQTLPAGLTLNDLVLDAEGDLKDGYAIKGSASLPGQGGKVKLALSALAETTGVRNADLLLIVADEPARKLHLKADANWESTLSASAQLSLQQAFPWQWLYPQDLGDVTLQQLDMQARLQGQQINSDLKARLTSAPKAISRR